MSYYQLLTFISLLTPPLRDVKPREYGVDLRLGPNRDSPGDYLYSSLSQLHTAPNFEINIVCVIDEYYFVRDRFIA